MNTDHPNGVRVRVFLNPACDAVNGYNPDHSVVEVAAYSTARAEDATILQEAFRLFNIGDDPAFGVPAPVAPAYRERRNRSLSVGDVVAIDDRFFACDCEDWTDLTAAPTITRHVGHGITPLEPPPDQQAETTRVTLAFGYNAGLPDTAATAWGCRAIIGAHGHVDMPNDRQFGAGPRIGELLDHLNDRVCGAWADRAGELLRDGVITTRVPGEAVLHRDDTVTIKGNTQGSGGYLYVCAYFTKE